MAKANSYGELKRRMKEVALLHSTGGILEWDQQTYMPARGTAHRAEMTSQAARLAHGMFTDPRVGELLGELEESDLAKRPASVEAANIRELRRRYDKQTRLSPELVEELNKTTALAHEQWKDARERSDFKRFEPWLVKVLALVRKKAEAYGGEPYNALLDEYEPGAQVAALDGVFTDLRRGLTTLLEKIRGAAKRPDRSIIERPYDVARQRILGESVIQAMGFDFNAGRLDVTTHPFCVGIGPGDTRILTNYKPHNLIDALFSSMHEAGHGLYEMGLDKAAEFGMPAGEAASMGMHESQSRIWENQIGRSLPFWSYFFPQAQRLFRTQLAGVTLDDFYGAVNIVQPSYIRVESDEVTYNLHILLRYELERLLVDGELKPKDVPGEWDARFKKYFGLEVDRPANGCLQDVHWSAGLIGYFPTYTLGNIYSAQFYARAQADIPDLESRVSRGEFQGFRDWLRKNIHIHGRRYRADDLCRRVTGRGMDHEPLLQYLEKKFSALYSP
ncbi:MAG: carboxypeptidase M32 [Elusimicrobiota bacterium]